MPRNKASGKYAGTILDGDGFINSQQLAEFIGETVNQLNLWASRGGGPRYHKPGRHRKYWKADVREWLDESWFTSAGNRTVA